MYRQAAPSHHRRRAHYVPNPSTRLPGELFYLILEYLRYSDLNSIKSCSLVNREWYFTSQPLIHRSVTLTFHKPTGTSVIPRSRRDPTIIYPSMEVTESVDMVIHRFMTSHLIRHIRTLTLKTYETEPIRHASIPTQTLLSMLTTSGKIEHLYLKNVSIHSPPLQDPSQYRQLPEVMYRGTYSLRTLHLDHPFFDLHHVDGKTDVAGSLNWLGIFRSIRRLTIANCYAHLDPETYNIVHEGALGTARHWFATENAFVNLDGNGIASLVATKPMGRLQERSVCIRVCYMVSIRALGWVFRKWARMMTSVDLDISKVIFEDLDRNPRTSALTRTFWNDLSLSECPNLSNLHLRGTLRDTTNPSSQENTLTISSFISILHPLLLSRTSNKSHINTTLTSLTFTFTFSGICPELLRALTKLDWSSIISTLRRFVSLHQLTFRFVLAVPSTANGGLDGMWVSLEKVLSYYMREWFCPTGKGRIVVERPGEVPRAVEREKHCFIKYR